MYVLKYISFIIVGPNVLKSLILKIFEPFLKSCTVEVRVLRGRVPRGLTVYAILC